MNVDDGSQISFLAQLTDQPHDLARGFWVQRGGRLIHKKQGRVLNQGPRYAHPLPLTTGQFVCTLVRHRQQTDAVQQTKSLIDILLREFAEKAAPESDISQTAGQDIFHDGQPLNKGIFLEDHTHPAAFLAQTTGSQSGQIGAVQYRFARRWSDQPVDAADQG